MTDEGGGAPETGMVRDSIGWMVVTGGGEGLLLEQYIHFQVLI